ncbi:hypothetical protein [Microbacterium sp. SLBN-146]|uniref:hypothetical protein n=1 Tax=Microbacterium sp. SLBN-146 TaxID=2768457 RepID=UPI001151FE64|nr:hypothetical protein [Microbacterium sp. SLBN-146]TQJ30963.1 hypothetical protein FBY39_1422 [Microbacterium sp. SLBN-146]
MSDNNDKIPAETPADGGAAPATPEAADAPPAPSAEPAAATLPLQPTQPTQPAGATEHRPLWKRTGARVAAASLVAVLLLGGGFGAGWVAASGASMARSGFAENGGPGVAPWDDGDAPEGGMPGGGVPGRGDGSDRGQGVQPGAPGTRPGRDDEGSDTDDGDDGSGTDTPDSDS